MKNVYDIKFEKKLEYILTGLNDKECQKISLDKKKVAILAYLYYEDTLDIYLDYIENVYEKIDVYIITSNKKIVEIITNIIGRNKINIIEKPNVGRDISGLLIAAKPVVNRYEYVCFVHDKKAHDSATEKETRFWIENIWGNMIGSLGYISQVLELFIDNEKLGVLVPPAPVGEHFCTWYGYGWHGSYEATKRLSEQLGLICDLDEEKPPITIGTALWFKSKALDKLFDYHWTYDDFDDRRLVSSDYISYGVERIFAYVAQDAGFFTGEVMSMEYIRKQNLFLQYSMAEIFKHVQQFYPFPTLYNAKYIDRNIKRMVDYAVQKRELYLYGAGQVGSFCLSILRKKGIEPKCFWVSDIPKQEVIDGVSVVQVGKNAELSRESGVIITVTDRISQKQIKSVLDKARINYFVFWEDE